MRYKIEDFKSWWWRQNRERQKFIKYNLIWTLFCIFELIEVLKFNGAIAFILEKYEITRFDMNPELIVRGFKACVDVMNKTGDTIWFLFCLLVLLFCFELFFIVRFFRLSKSDQFEFEENGIYVVVLFVNLLLFFLLCWFASVPVLFLVISFIFMSIWIVKSKVLTN